MFTKLLKLSLLVLLFSQVGAQKGRGKKPKKEKEEDLYKLLGVKKNAT